MNTTTRDGRELVRVTEFHIGEETLQLKVGIADDGTFLIVLPPSKRTEDAVISLERTNAVAILRHLLGLLENGSAGPTSAHSGDPRDR